MNYKDMNGKISTRIPVIFKLMLFSLLAVVSFDGMAQYDYEHYVPPFYNGSDNVRDIGYHRAILSTNSIKDIRVYIYRGYNEEIEMVTISNTSPYSYPFLTPTNDEKGDIVTYPHSYNFPENVVGAKELNKVLPKDGLRFHSPDGPFFVNIRHSTTDQGASLTAKGTYAYGTEFLSGHIYTDANSATSRRSHFISVMATEDNTTVNFTDIKVSRLSEFDSGTNSLISKIVTPTDIITATLMRGESYIIAVDHDLPGFSNADKNAMNGTSITSSKPIVVNTGSWTSGPNSGQDIGVDQIVPIDQLRDEYIVMKGQGNNTTERPIVVATKDNTEVVVNGNSVGTIPSKGQFLVLDNPYNSDGNAFIKTNGKAVYVYQTLSGNSSSIGPTVGLNFIPPVSTSGIREVTVPYAETLAIKGVTGVITILSQTGAVISYSKNGEETLHPISEITTSPVKISGHPEWEIYKLTENLNGSYRFYSNKSINVAWLVKSGVVGAAGYYSGFTKEVSKILPELDLNAELELICESYDDEIRVTINEPIPDFYEWYVNDFTGDPIIVNGPLLVDAPDEETSYYVVGSYRDPLMDQLYNGSFFELSVDSDYEEVFGNLRNPGEYTLVRQTIDADPSFKDASFTDMDNDYMFMAISKNVGDTIYRGTKVDVVDGFNYIVKLHGRSVVNTQNLRVMVNGDTVVDKFTIDNPNKWQSVSALWKPNGAENAVIKILNNNASGVQSVFALDSITFVQAVQDTAVFVARVVPNYSYDNNGEIFHFCKGVSNSLDVSNGDTSWYDYSWSKKNGEIFVDLIDDAEYSGTNTHELTFLNTKETQEGEYRCTIGFKPAYQQCGTSESSVNVDLTVFVDEDATVSITPENPRICEGSTITLQASVSGTNTGVKWYVNDDPSPVWTSPDFNFPVTYASGTYTVRCDAENGCGIVSDEVTLEVLSAPRLTNLFVNEDLCEGDNIVLTAEATGNGTLIYDWKEGAVDLAEHGAVLTIPATMDHRTSVFSVNVRSAYTVGSETVECRSADTESKTGLDIYPKVDFSDLVSKTVCEGTASHTFSVNNMPEEESYYDFIWYKDGTIQTNSTSSYIISPVNISDGGEYKVVVSNRCNSKESIANLTVTPKLVVNGINIDQKGPFCTPTNVTVTFTDNGAALKYVARNSAKGIEIDPISNPYTFEINSTNEGSWVFSAEGNCGSAPISQSFELNMIPDFGNLSINDITTCIGKDVDFIADIDDIPALSNLTYQWKDNSGAVIAGETSAVLSLTNVQDANIGTYTCTVTDQCTRSKFVTADLNIEKVTTSTTAAVIEKCVGDSDFRIDIAYFGSPTFEWRFNDPNGAVISTAEFYEVAPLAKTDAGVYYCTVTLACGDVIKIERKLVVYEHVSIVSPADETIHICEGEQPILKVNVNGNEDDYTITWTDNDDVALAGYGDVNQIQLNAHNTPGTFTYKAKVNSFCDNLSKNYIVIVHEKPELAPIDPVTKCEGDIALSAVITGADFIDIEWWNSDESTLLGTGTNYTIVGATHPSSEGTYIVKVTTNYCGDIQANAMVDIYEPVSYKPIVNLTPSPCEGAPLKLVVEGKGDGVQYSWHKDLITNPQLGTSSVLDLGNAKAIDHDGKYICVLTSSNGCSGTSVEFTVDVKDNASITLQPEDVSLCQDITPVIFTLTAEGEGNLTYTWYDKDDEKVSEKTNDPDFSIADPLAYDGQVYYCIVTPEKCSSVKSEQAGLHVKKKIVITNEPKDLTIAENGNATFTVEAEGEPIINYQWQISTDGGGNWSDIVGETSKTLSLTTVPLSSDGEQYRCMVSNDCGSETTRAAQLTVDANAKITVQPVDLNACVDDNVEFKIDASGIGLSYDWQYRENNSDPFVDASVVGTLKDAGKTFEIDPVTVAMKDWEFKCVVTGVGDPDESNVVKIKVFTPVTFDPIENDTLCNGSGVLFSVENLNGSTPYSYSWKREGIEISTGTKLNLNAASATDNDYQIEISNGVCPAVIDEFSINHHPDLDVAWANVNETCIGASPAEILGVTVNESAGGLTYLWTKDEDATILSSTATYSLPGISSDETGTYTVKVEDICMPTTLSGFVNVYDPIVKVNSWDLKMDLCHGEELILNVVVSGDYPTYAWTVPNVARTPGAGSSIKFDSVSADDAGTYSCTVSGQCGTPVSYTIDVKVLTVPSITTGIDVLQDICEGDTLVLGPIGIDGTYDAIKWTLSDDSEDTVSGQSLTLGAATTAMEGNYKVSVSNKCGEDVSVGAQIVNPTPTLATIDDQTVCQGEDVIFRAITTGRNLHYQWKFDGHDQGVDAVELVIDGSSVLPSDEYTQKTYNVECIVTNDNDCGEILNETAQLIVNPGTILNATLKNVVKYVDENYTMTLDVTGKDLVYSWTHEVNGVKTPLPEITVSSINFTNIQMSDAGYYNCVVTGTCGTRLASGKLTVKEPVKIIDGLADIEEKCVGESLNLTISASGQITSTEWFKDGVPLGNTELTHYISELSSTDAGTYTCVIKGEGIPAEGIEESVIVRVYSNTTLNAPLGNQTLCEGAELNWNPNVSGANLTYKWVFGTVEISTNKNLHYDALTLTQEGDYEVQVSGHCGNVSTSGKLNIIQLPVFVAASIDKEVCENTSLVEFSVEYTGENLKYQWRKNGADIAGKTSPVLSMTSIQLKDDAVYNCKVYSTCDTLFSPEAKLKVIPQLKIVTQPVDLKVCAGEEVRFTVAAEGNDVSYQWMVDGVSINGATNSAIEISNAQPGQSGYYTCSLTDFCTTTARSTKPAQLVVHGLPNTEILGRMRLCAREDRVTYTTIDQPEIIYDWSVNGGLFAGPEEGLRTRITWGEGPDGSLDIVITDLATGCKAKIDSLVTLHALPAVTMNSIGAKGVCEKEFELYGGFPAGGIYWVDKISQELFAPSLRGPGNYAVHYSYTDEYGCSNVSSTTNLRVDTLPVVNIIDDVTIGICSPFQLTAQTKEDNILWSPADHLDDPTSLTPVYTPVESEVLIATVVDEHGCVGIDLVNLTVAPLPVVTTIPDTTVSQCNQLELTTDIVGDMDEINWSHPEHLDHSDVRSPRIIDAPAGTHTYVINVTDLYGCDATDEVNVTMVADPKLGEDKFGCEGDKFEVDVTGKENPVWNDKYVDNFRTIENPGTYVLEVSNPYGCGDEQTFVINPAPKAGLKDTLIFEGQTVTLAPNLPMEYSPYFFEWQDGSILQRFEVSETGNYVLKIVDHLGCFAKDSAYVEVKPVGIESPNAFTPGSNNENSKFYLKDINVIEEFEMYVYDRWGELLFKTNETGYNGGWDGTYKGKLCPSGAYVWIAFINGELTNKGTFILVR